MCGVFYIDDDTLKDIQQLVVEIDQNLNKAAINKDIHPTETAPVLIAGKNGMCLTTQKWGYPGFQNKGVIFNARVETVCEKRFFQNGILHHRAVIPAAYFYEWNTNKEKNTFYRRERTPLFLAGFFDLIENEERFVILTTKANSSMQRVHDRMPLILERDQLEDWIYKDDKLENTLKSMPVLLERYSEFEQMTLF